MSARATEGRATSGRPALEVTGVRHAFDGQGCLHGVDLAVLPGELLCLLGPSGCGKTTLLRIIAGLETPDAGSVTVQGQRVAGDGTALPPEARDVGLVFQDFALFPHLTVADNVAFGLRGRPAAERRARVEEMLQLVGLSGHAARHPHELSGGEQQRVALARALAPAPGVLLLDEPFSSLDATERVRVRDETRAILHRAGTAAVLVTHDGDEAMQLGDRIAMLRAGELVQLGTPEQLFFEPADLFVAGFFGGVDVFDARVEGGVAHTPLGPVPMPAGAAPPDGPARVVVRHEAVALVDPEPGGGEDGVPAVVTESRLVGGRRVTRLRLGEGGHHVSMRHGAGERLEAERRVRVCVAAPELVHVFAAD